jgi:hypothetical protein
MARSTSDVPGEYLNEVDASTLIGVAPKTLRQWRARSPESPPFIKTPGGSVRYNVTDLRAWMESFKVDPGNFGSTRHHPRRAA